jgi:hypothetical protein
MLEKNSKAFYRYVEGQGHYCGPCCNGQYKMIPEWIDVDNKVWTEPYHLYGDKIYGWE